MTRISIGPVKSIDVIDSNSLLKHISEAIQKKSFFHVVLLDSRLFVQLLFKKRLLNIVSKADRLVPRGRLMVWGLGKLFSDSNLWEHSESLERSESDYDEELYDRDLEPVDPSEIVDHRENHGNMNLSLLLFRHFEKRDIGFFFLGGSPDDSYRCTRHVRQGFPHLKVLGNHPAEDIKAHRSELLEKLRKVAPQILIIDCDRGKQELWIQESKAILGSTVCVGMVDEIKLFSGRAKTSRKLFGTGIILNPLIFIVFITAILLYKTVWKRKLQCEK